MDNTPQIPGYVLKQKLGSGGMAAVYLATQQNLERPVALKIMDATLADPTFRERFLKEGRIIAKLSHPNIVTVHNVGEFEGHYYMDMEYVEGGTLEERIQRGVSLGEAVTILRQIAAALGYAHRSGFVHRDVKPANILFRSNGTAILSDFGIAKGYQDNTQLTQAGWLVGTPSYMSPEQGKGEPADARSDLYSLGIVFYEMLIGVKPYQASNAASTIMLHITQPIPRLPTGLLLYQNILDRLLAKEPMQRFVTAEELIEALDEVDRAPAATSPMPSASSRQETLFMDGEWRVRVESDTVRGPGYAAFVIEGGNLPAQGLSVCLKRSGFGSDDLGPDGWQNGEHWFSPMASETGPAGSVRLIVGPDVVRHMDEGNYMLGLTAPGWTTPREKVINWRDVTPPRAAGSPARRGRMGSAAPQRQPPPEPPQDLPPVIHKPTDSAPPIEVTPVADAKPVVPKQDDAIVPPPPPVNPWFKGLALLGGTLVVLAALGIGGYLWWRPLPPQPTPTPSPKPKLDVSTQSAREALKQGLSPDQAYALGQQFKAYPDGIQGAFLLYLMAAERGHAGAAAAVADMYDPTQQGPTAVPKRRADQAYKWYRLAAAQGDAQAAQRLTALRSWVEREAAKGDAEAQELLRNWQ